MSACRPLGVMLVALLLAVHVTGKAEGADACRFTADDVIGAWILPAPGSGVVADDAREFVIERDGESRIFSEYLHHRPMGDGIWVFDATSCILTLDYGDYNDTLRVEKDVDGGAHLVDEGGQIYRRLATNEA